MWWRMETVRTVYARVQSVRESSSVTLEKVAEEGKPKSKVMGGGEGKK